MTGHETFESLFIIFRQRHYRSSMHSTVISPSFHPESEYLHLVTPTLRQEPASGAVGELVALPLFMKDVVAFVEDWMDHRSLPFLTSKYLSTWLLINWYTGPPQLPLPICNA